MMAVVAIDTLASHYSLLQPTTFPFPSSFGTVCDGSVRQTRALPTFLPALPRSCRSEEGRNRKRIWRRRKLAKKDPMSFKLERVPFLEEKVRKITENGEIISGDIERLLRSEDNRYQFVNEVAAEAKAYVEGNRDEYGHKKAIYHVLSNRMNDLGLSRPEAYLVPDPFNPGPGYLKEEDW